MNKLIARALGLFFIGSALQAPPKFHRYEAQAVHSLNRQYPGHNFHENHITRFSVPRNEQGPPHDPGYTLTGVTVDSTTLIRQPNDDWSVLDRPDETLRFGDLGEIQRADGQITTIIPVTIGGETRDILLNTTERTQITSWNTPLNATLSDYIDEQGHAKLHSITRDEIMARQHIQFTHNVGHLLQLEYVAQNLIRPLEVCNIVYALTHEKDLKIFLELIRPGSGPFFVPIGQDVEWKSQKEDSFAKLVSCIGLNIIQRQYKSYRYPTLGPWLPKPAGTVSEEMIQRLQDQIESRRALMEPPAEGCLTGVAFFSLADSALPSNIYRLSSTPRLVDSDCIWASGGRDKFLMQCWEAQWQDLQAADEMRRACWYIKTDLLLEEAAGGVLGSESSFWRAGMYRCIQARESIPGGQDILDEKWQRETEPNQGEEITFRCTGEWGVAQKLSLDRALFKVFNATDVICSLVNVISLRELEMQIWGSFFKKRQQLANASSVECAFHWDDIEHWGLVWEMTTRPILSFLESVKFGHGTKCRMSLADIIRRMKKESIPQVILKKFTGSPAAENYFSGLYKPHVTIRR